MTDKLILIINEIQRDAGVKPTAIIKNDMNIRNDLGLDSISIAELIAQVDITFNTQINIDEIILTVGDIRNKLNGNDENN